ncbi:hypothetical protein ABFS83_03G031300 [Erythranthe nasuta]
MDPAPGVGLYPLHRCKTIHLVRHAQGFHNVAGVKDHRSPDFFDSQITPLGWDQVNNLRKHVHSSGLSTSIELVVVSPLLRTMQTAVGVFGGESYVDVPPLMAENTNRPPISSLNSPPFVAMELCRERLGVNWCDKRRSISEYMTLFPAIDFSLIESDADTLWELDVRETDEDLAKRGLNFMKWLWTREEREIAVVTHSALLLHTLAAFGDDCHSCVKNEICKPFNNCELRPLVIVDRSMIASTSTKTNYGGKLPRDTDAPSVDGDDKN